MLLVLQDTDESNYKWGLRTSATNDFYIDNHQGLQTRIELLDGGACRLYGAGAENRGLDVTDGSVRSAGGVVNQQRGDPTTDELAPGENMQFNSDGSDTGEPGDLVYAVNDDGTIKTSIIAKRSNAT